MQQMSLENWLAQHPTSQILQYNTKYKSKYDFLTKLMNYEASFPGWHRQKTPALVIGIELDGYSRAYDWKTLQQQRIVMDTINEHHLLLLSSVDGTSPFAYRRSVAGEILQFEISENQLIDINTQSTWNLFGFCTSGKLKGTQLPKVQIYQQFIRAWLSFHPNTTFYKF